MARTNRETIYEGIQSLEASGRRATRRILSQMLNLKLSIVDDHIDRLEEDGMVRRLGGGVMELVAQHAPSRAMTVTRNLDGSCCVEFGDVIFSLTPQEERMLAMHLHGAAMQHMHNTRQNELVDTIQAIGNKVIQQNDKVLEMSKTLAKLKRDPQHPDLFHVQGMLTSTSSDG
jgi:DNA-binding Lrp family transcriptional regulator